MNTIKNTGSNVNIRGHLRSCSLNGNEPGDAIETTWHSFYDNEKFWTSACDQLKSITGQRITLKKHFTSMDCTLEPRYSHVTQVSGYSILGEPGAVSRAGRKGATKVFKHRRKSPWVPTLTGPFPTGQANAGFYLATKNALYHCAQSANSFSCFVFVSSPQLPGSFTKLSQPETKELPMSRKTFRMPSAGAINLY